MSKYFIAGEPIADFIKRPDEYTGCWVCRSTEDANALQRAIKSATIRTGRRTKVYRMPSILNDEVRYVVCAQLLPLQISQIP